MAWAKTSVQVRVLPEVGSWGGVRPTMERQGGRLQEGVAYPAGVRNEPDAA
jgi:hypothetical protein